MVHSSGLWLAGVGGKGLGLAWAGHWVFSTLDATYLLTGLQELINGHHPILIPVHFLQPKPCPQCFCVSPEIAPAPSLCAWQQVGSFRSTCSLCTLPCFPVT